MLTYNNNPAVKQMYIDRMNANGRKWCSIHSCDFAQFGREIAPEWLARLGDVLHEETSDLVRPTLGLRILEAIPVGADISHLEIKMKIFILNQSNSIVKSLDNVDLGIKTLVLCAINQCIEAQVKDCPPIEIEAASSAAREARASAGGVKSLSWAASSAVYSLVGGELSAKSVSLAARAAAISALCAPGAICDSQAEYLLKILSEVQGDNGKERGCG